MPRDYSPPWYRSRSRRRRSRSPDVRRPVRRSHRYDSPPKESTLVANLHGLNEQDTLGSIRAMHQLTGAADAAVSSMRADQQRLARELYVGNIPPGLTIHKLIDRLNEILLSMGAVVMPGRPIVSGWIGGEGQFAFLEFRTAEECSNALSLNGYPLEGYALKVGKPKAGGGAVMGSIANTNMYQATPFSLDEEGWIMGAGRVAPIEESTKIETLVLVGGGMFETDEEKAKVARMYEELVAEFGEVETIQLSSSSLLNASAFVFKFKDVDCQRKCAHYATKHAFRWEKDRTRSLALVRYLDAVNSGYVSLPYAAFVPNESREIHVISPTRIVWLTNFPPVAPEAELLKELQAESAKFGKCEKVQFIQVPKEDIEPECLTGIQSQADAPVAVAVIAFETETAAKNCRKYIGNALKCFYMSVEKYESQDFSNIGDNKTVVQVELNGNRDNETGPLPTIRSGEIISAEKELTAQYQVRSKTRRTAPEDLEIID